MSENTKIEWTDHTFNLWWGCTKVSTACHNCYAEEIAKRFNKCEWGAGKTRYLLSESNNKKPYTWNRKAGKAGIREKVFTSSMGDVFDVEVPLEWKSRLFKIISDTSYSLDWLILTKRAREMYKIAKSKYGIFNPVLSNNWVGVTVERQHFADYRIPYLINTPAKIRFLSCEPLLGPLDLSPWIDKIDWIIVGGESGKNARYMDPEWVEDIQRQCEESNTAFFFKQWGKQEKGSLLNRAEYKQFPETNQGDLFNDRP